MRFFFLNLLFEDNFQAGSIRLSGPYKQDMFLLKALLHEKYLPYAHHYTRSWLETALEY